MVSYTNKASVNAKSQLHQTFVSKNNVATSQLVDNRKETIAQRKLQRTAENSPQTTQLRAFQKMANNKQPDQEAQPIQQKANTTGLPDNLKSGIENLSGYSMDDVKVHYNSNKPAQLQAHAYAQGTDIHLASGQERHLPHEAWHVVQQKQGRVQPTMQMRGKVNINDDSGLEKEADVMGNKALKKDNQNNSDSFKLKNHIKNNLYQRIAWHEKNNGTASAQAAPNISTVTDKGQTTPINVASYMFNGPMYDLSQSSASANKTELITDIAAKIGTIKHPTNNQFLTKKQLEVSLGINQTIPHGNINTVLPTAGKQNIYKGSLDPYIIRASGKTTSNEKLALNYQFGRDSYGYIVKIEQEDKTYTMHDGRGQEELAKDQIKELTKGTEDKPLFDQFSSAHDTGNSEESISEVASKSTLDKELTLYPSSKKKDRQKQVSKLEEKSKRLDAVAKIGGEGARWKCVRKLAQTGKLTNGSRFYTKNYHAREEGYIGITFQTLWGVWASEFDSAFDIEDSKVVEVLLDLYDLEDQRIITMKEKDITNNDCSLN